MFIILLTIELIILNKLYIEMGIGDWGLAIGPNPQSPIHNPQSPIKLKSLFIIINFNLVNNLYYYLE